MQAELLGERGDSSLVRYSLSLTPTQRLKAVERQIVSLRSIGLRVRHADCS